MASAKPVPPRAAAAAGKSGKKGKESPPTKRGPAAVVRAGSDAAAEPLGAAKDMPGWRDARTVLGEALTVGNTGLLLEVRDKAVVLRRRVGAEWQPVEPPRGDDLPAVFAALKKMAVPAVAGKEEPEYVVSAGKLPRRACRVAARTAAKGEQVLVMFGAELPVPERLTLRQRIGALLGALVPFRKQPPPPERDPSLPRVELAAAGAEAEVRTQAASGMKGFETACDLVAAAVRDRAGAIVFDAGPQGVTVRFAVDGVASPVPKLEPALLLDKAALVSVVGVLKALAGFDAKERGPQMNKVTAMVETKPWACTVAGGRSASGERLEVVIDHVRPKFKTLADLGMPPAVVARVQEMLKFESGLILLAAPRGGGLSTLVDGVVTAADRLLRDFVLLEDAKAPGAEVQNVRPVRWDSRTGGKPVAALDASLRDYPNVLVTNDIEDAELARRLVAQADQGRLVIVGVRAADAADAIARFVTLCAAAPAVGGVLRGVVGVRLVRKLCPKCRREFFPAVAVLGKLGLDPEADITLFRPAKSGCTVCTGTGYLGRTAACELATGPTVNAYAAKAADAAVLRKAAEKDGMVSCERDAYAKAARGVTSVEEVQRVFPRS